MSTTYSVVLQLSTTGSLDAKLQNVGQKAGAAHNALKAVGEHARGLGERIAGLGEHLGGMVEGVVDKVTGIGEAFLKVGAAAAVATATYAVGHLNNELEQTQISLGAIAQAQGFANTFEEGFGMAGKQLKAMKQDVKTLPGDLGQLSNIMKMIATPAAQGGANMDQIRKLAGRTMLTGTILGVPMEVASREMANLLAGRAGAHNILGSRLGFIGGAAKQFNAMDAAHRLAAINKELDKYAGATNRFSQSFIAQWTTLKDNIKYSVLAEATAPLFERIKTSIGAINSLFEHNADRVAAFTRMVGTDLVKAWDMVAARVAKLEPIFWRLVEGASRLTSTKAEGFLAKAALGLLGAKVAGPAISGASGMLGGALSMGGKIAQIAGSASAMEGLASAFAVLANPVTIGAVAAGLAALGTAAVAVVGAIHAITDETSSFHDYAVTLWHEISAIAEDSFERIRGAVGELVTAITPFVDQLGTELLYAIREAAPLLSTVADGFLATASAIRHVLGVMRAIPGVGGLIPGGDDEGASGGPARTSTAWSDRGGGGHKMKEAAEVFGEAVAKRGAGGGGGGTHVQKVEIVVNSNQDPSRIARLTAIEWRKWAKNPTRSPHVADYSAPNAR